MWRLPNGLHAKLVAGVIAFPDFAGTKQLVLEVFTRDVPGGRTLLEARGSIYNFDLEGFFDLGPAAEAAARIMDKPRTTDPQGKVINITRDLRRRRWASEQTWKPSSALLEKVRAAVDHRSSMNAIPTLRAPGG